MMALLEHSTQSLGLVIEEYWMARLEMLRQVRNASRPQASTQGLRNHWDKGDALSSTLGSSV